jgi:hypothetical protein
MVDTPVVIDGQIVVRPIMNLSLTADHRVVDGVQAAAFLQRIDELLENTDSAPCITERRQNSDGERSRYAQARPYHDRGYDRKMV